MKSAPILPESQEDIQIHCDTQGLISLAMVLVSTGWDARDDLGEERHVLTMDRHRQLALQAVAALKMAALEKQRAKDRLDRMTEQAGPPILGLDGEPMDGT